LIPKTGVPEKNCRNSKLRNERLLKKHALFAKPTPEKQVSRIERR
jgi:hypothetical protein